MAGRRRARRADRSSSWASAGARRSRAASSSTDPARYAGAAILYGTLPFDAGVPVDRGRLANLPILVAQGEADHVIPRELLDRTWDYLHTDSGAPTVGRRDPGGHGITGATLHRLAEWLADRLGHVRPTAGPHRAARRRLLADTAGCRATAPLGTVTAGLLVHPAAAALAERPARPPGDAVRPHQRAGRRPVRGLAHLGPGGARFTLPGGSGPDDAYLVPQGREFAHLHPAHDGSLHLALPPAQAADLVAHGWGVPPRRPARGSPRLRHALRSAHGGRARDSQSSPLRTAMLRALALRRGTPMRSSTRQDAASRGVR